MKSCLMTGAALVLLATLPALAGHSTRAEREATRQLNLEAAREAAQRQMPVQQAPAATARQVPSEARSAMAVNAPPSAAPTTKVQVSALNANVADTPSADAADSGAQAAAVPLSSLTNPPTKIATANVLDASGKTVGAVQRVEVSPQGKPTKVAVALIGSQDRMVVLDANTVRYDASKNQVVAGASSEQINALSGRS